MKTRMFLNAFACLCLASLINISTPAHAQSTNAGPILIDLPAALRLAGARNLDVQIARQRLNEARAAGQSAIQQFFPWLNLGGNFARHEGNIQAVDGPILDVEKQSYAGGGALVAQVTIGDAIYNSLAARQLIHAADHALAAQRDDAIFNAARGYFELVKAHSLAGVLSEAIRTSRNYQDQLHEAVSAGLAFKGDELRIQTQTDRYEINLRQIRELQRIAAADLARTLHLDPAVDLAPVESELTPLELFPTNSALALLVGQALASRPELKQSHALAAAAQEARNGALYGPLIPSLNASAYGGGLGGGVGSSWGNFGNSEDYFVGLGWRIGQGGLFDVGRANTTKARLEIAKLGEEKQRDEVTRQVVEAFTRAESLRDQLSMSSRTLAAAAETWRLTAERKQFGVGLVLEDLQAQQELTRARSDYVATIAENNKNQYALSRAVGSGAGSR